MTRLSRTFAARLTAFGEVEALLQEFALRVGLRHEDSMRLLLIVEELFTNTVRHGHGGDCDAPIGVTLGAAAAHVELAYEDTAPPFDPIEHLAGSPVDLAMPGTRAASGNHSGARGRGRNRGGKRGSCTHRRR